ncbi:MAG: hypothetical protein H7210_10610 [Pyrinomonadaceae bacterium]|nr:hypothetical protein [Phycisphaerales bacterium]
MFRLTPMLACVMLAGSASAQCGDWSIVSTPSPGTQNNLLVDVAATRPYLAIAVGNYAGGGSAPQPLIVLWKGSAWSQFPLPNTAGLGTFPQVEGVGRTPNGDLWVVGYIRTPAPTDQLPLLLRWHGGAWDHVTTPILRPQNTHPFGPRGGLANDAAGLASDDVWVVGTAVGFGDASSTSVPMALHYNGSTWDDVPVPIMGNRHNSFERVSASAPDNVWAVGTWRNQAGGFKALIERWDGFSWTSVPNPGDGLGTWEAYAVLALAPDNVWVSGTFPGPTHLIHWNGSAWETGYASIPGIFASFAATGPQDIWASCAINSTFYHFDGFAWSPVQGSPVPGSQYVLRGWGMDTVGACDVWAVGGFSDGVTQLTLSERLGSAICPGDLNNDGQLNSQDFFDFLGVFFNQDPGSDFNIDGSVNSQDFFDFVAAFFAGC